MPRSRRRPEVTRARARKVQIEQRKAEARRLSPRQFMRRRILGWSLVALGIAVAVFHWLEHLTVISVFPSVIGELGFGYPMGGALVVAGVIVLSKYSV
jgi:hypothetical protein